MDATTLLAIGLVVAGALAVGFGITARDRHRPLDLADILGLPETADIGTDAGGEGQGRLATRTLRIATSAVERWDRPGSLRDRIERADIALRPAELVIIAGAGAMAVAAVIVLVFEQPWLAPIPLVLAPLGTNLVLDHRARRRAERFAAQLPDALGLVAGSLEAGHTFLRAIQLMADELEPPLADEFARVVSETQLGVPLVPALQRMADRLNLRDVDLVVRAIRIQQTVGGQLADLLTTLAELMRSREDVRREVKVLTAEGRMSAWVLGAMPIALFGAVQVINPGYLDPLLQGWGLVTLGLTCVSMAIGIWLILRMVDRVEV